jgi:hypothetical protein
MILLEQFYNIAFHASAGALLGLGVASSRSLFMLIVAILIQTIAGYLVLFVQVHVMSIKTLLTILGFYYAAFLFAVYYGINRFRKQALRDKKKA